MNKRFNTYLRPEIHGNLAELTDIFRSPDKSAAFNEAILFAFKYAKRGTTEIQLALSLYDQIRHLTKDGYVLTAEKPDGSDKKQLLMLGLGG